MSRTITSTFLLSKIGSQPIDDVKQLNIWGSDYEDVSLLSMIPNLQVLQLSKNKVKNLSQLVKCKQLKELYLRQNNVSDLTELEYLRELYNLRVLNLLDNPIVEHPDYKKTVLKYCMALQVLDDAAIKDSDRQIALEPEIYKPKESEIHEEEKKEENSLQNNVNQDQKKVSVKKVPKQSSDQTKKEEKQSSASKPTTKSVTVIPNQPNPSSDKKTTQQSINSPSVKLRPRTRKRKQQTSVSHNENPCYIEIESDSSPNQSTHKTSGQNKKLVKYQQKISQTPLIFIPNKGATEVKKETNQKNNEEPHQTQSTNQSANPDQDQEIKITLKESQGKDYLLDVVKGLMKMLDDNAMLCLFKNLCDMSEQ